MTENEERFIRLTGKPVDFVYFGTRKNGFELSDGYLYIDYGKLRDETWYISTDEYKKSVKYKQRLHTFDNIMEAIGILYSELVDLRIIVENDIDDD